MQKVTTYIHRMDWFLCLCHILNSVQWWRWHQRGLLLFCFRRSALVDAVELQPLVRQQPLSPLVGFVASLAFVSNDFSNRPFCNRPFCSCSWLCMSSVELVHTDDFDKTTNLKCMSTKCLQLLELSATVWARCHRAAVFHHAQVTILLRPATFRLQVQTVLYKFGETSDKTCLFIWHRKVDHTACTLCLIIQ